MTPPSPISLLVRLSIVKQVKEAIHGPWRYSIMIQTCKTNTVGINKTYFCRRRQLQAALVMNGTQASRHTPCYDGSRSIMAARSDGAALIHYLQAPPWRWIKSTIFQTKETKTNHIKQINFLVCVLVSVPLITKLKCCMLDLFSGHLWTKLRNIPHVYNGLLFQLV